MTVMMDKSKFINFYDNFNHKNYFELANDSRTNSFEEGNAWVSSVDPNENLHS